MQIAFTLTQSSLNIRILPNVGTYHTICAYKSLHILLKKKKSLQTQKSRAKLETEQTEWKWEIQLIINTFPPGKLN